MRKNKTQIEMIHRMDGLIIPDLTLMHVTTSFNRCKLVKYVFI